MIISQIFWKLILCLIIQSSMEPTEKKQPIINLLVATKLVFYTVLEFLDTSDLSDLYISVKGASNSNHASLVAILQSYLYIRLHMMSTDRSYYFFVYENSRFRKIQKLTLAFLVQSNNKFNQLFQLRQERNIFFTNILAQSNCQQVTNELEQIFNDPQIPTMRLVRETIGIGCTSTFQNYLVSLNQDAESMPIEEYPNLSEFYQKRSNQSYIKQFFKIGHSKGKHPDYQKIKRLRLAPYLIKSQQRQNYQLTDNQMHNLLVGLFAMADEMVQASATYLQGIQDPFHRLMEFCFRYALYRNFVLSIQEKFEFVFEKYQSIYQETFESERVQLPRFSFWRPAMSKWLSNMSEFHKDCNKTFNLFLLKKRYQNIKQSIQNLQPEEKHTDYSVVRNWVNSLNIQQLCQIERPVNIQIYQIIEEELNYCAADYNEYQMDMSIDQISVHWCGYTKQKLNLPFCQFQNQTIAFNEAFYEALLKVQWEPATLINILKKDLSFLQKNNFLKDRVFANIILSAREKVSILSNQKQSLEYQHNNLDQRIEVSNQKSRIPEQIPSIEVRKFYSIIPMPEEEIFKYIQKKSIDTMDESDASFQDQQYEYRSQGQQIDQLQESSKVDEIQSFMEDQSSSIMQGQPEDSQDERPQMPVI